MATNLVLQRYGTQLIFADATDFPNAGLGPPTTAANSIILGTPTAVQLDLTGIAAGAARQSAKTATLAQVGTAWPIGWSLDACIENETAPALGGTYNFYWAASPSATAATGNPGNATGSDAAYTVADAAQLTNCFAILTVLNQVVNIGTQLGTLWMPHLYGSLIVVNNTSTATRSTVTAMDETHITLTPVNPDGQAAA